MLKVSGEGVAKFVCERSVLLHLSDSGTRNNFEDHLSGNYDDFNSTPIYATRFTMLGSQEKPGIARGILVRLAVA